jgi:hypothetical protein
MMCGNKEIDLNVSFEPFKEIVIMQRNRFPTSEDLARFASLLAGGKPTGLYWAEGVVFLYFPLPSSTEIVAKSLIQDKRVYWTFLGYSFMPTYSSRIETKERMIVPIIDVSSNIMFKKVTLWLKDQSSD